jgi:hypothetical protein
MALLDGIERRLMRAPAPTTKPVSERGAASGAAALWT